MLRSSFQNNIVKFLYIIFSFLFYRIDQTDAKILTLRKEAYARKMKGDMVGK